MRRWDGGCGIIGNRNLRCVCSVVGTMSDGGPGYGAGQARQGVGVGSAEGTCMGLCELWLALYGFQDSRVGEVPGLQQSWYVGRGKAVVSQGLHGGRRREG